MGTTLDSLRQNWLVKQVLVRRYERYFAHAVDTNLFRGVYRDFGEAQATIPTTKPKGYDHEGPAAMYGDRLSRIFTSDYPVVFWLSRGLLAPNTRVFDFGGHVGIAYYAYQKYVPFPEGISWRVLDVLAVTKAGEALSREKNARALSFTQDFRDADGCSLFLASGSLQYVDKPDLPAMLGALVKKPAHVIVNKLPVHERESFVTLQNIGTAFCPYRIFARDRFVGAMTALGYRLVDSWRTTENCYVPYHPEHSIAQYSGFYFTTSSFPAE